MLANTYKIILSVALPLMVGTFVQSIVMISDAAILSRYSITSFDASDLPARIACTVPRGDGTDGTYNPDQWMEPKEQRKVDEFIVFAMTAARQALTDANWKPESYEDQTRTGVMIGSGIGGIGGIYPSMLKHIHRLDAMWATQGHKIDVHLFGHWHQYLTIPNAIVNGSLKGYCEYARGAAFGYEPPRQALAIVTPERGIVQQMPVYAE
jgi:hypothetical protein